MRPEFEPQVVQFAGYPRGTIVIDTASHFLYLVEGSSRARRYAIAVGKEGLQFKGQVDVGDKQEWPRWIPTKEMQQRDPAKYAQYAEGMPGGGQNPLGARAIYLYQSGKDTHLRIHGTIAPETIGTNSSNGCFRMINEHVMDLYRRVPVGTSVVISVGVATTNPGKAGFAPAFLLARRRWPGARGKKPGPKLFRWWNQSGGVKR